MRDYSDIQHLANQYDPTWSPEKPYDERPAYKPTGDLRRDVLAILRGYPRYETIVQITECLGYRTYTKRISDMIQQLVMEEAITLAEVYRRLPALKHKHYCMSLRS